MLVCSSCGAEVAAGAKFCAKCGQPMEQTAAPGAEPGARPVPTGTGVGQDDNIMAALSYLIIPAIIFLVAEPYKSNRFIRFHSLQALYFLAASFGVNILLGVLSAVLSVVGIGFIIALMMPLISLAIFAVWIFVIIQAFQGKEYRLPIIGDFAAKQV